MSYPLYVSPYIYEVIKNLYEIEKGNDADGDTWREPVGFRVVECPVCCGYGGYKNKSGHYLVFCLVCNGVGVVAVKEE